MPQTKFIVIYDTYCGWCYGAAPIFDALVASGADVEPLHRHLFQGPLAYRMSHGKGDQVLKADARIHKLTGQEFSQRYIDNIVQSATEVLASQFTAQAAALVHEHGPEKEFSLRRRLETARYIEGVSAADRDSVVSALIAEGVSAQDAEQIGTPQLADRAEKTATKAHDLMSRVGAQGVPTMLKVSGKALQPIDHSSYYHRPEDVIEQLD